MVEPVLDTVGSLREYAGKVKPNICMKRMKEKAWEIAVRDKATKNVTK